MYTSKNKYWYRSFSSAPFLKSELGIRDILVRIWIRIQLGIRLLSSMTLKKISYFVSFSLHIIFGLKINFLLKFCIKILFCKHYFSLFNTFMRKGKDPDPGGLKTYGSCGSGSPTLGLRFPSKILAKKNFR